MIALVSCAVHRGTAARSPDVFRGCEDADFHEAGMLALWVCVKTNKAIPAGARVKCPSCNEFFHVQASDDGGLLETIPLQEDVEATEVKSASTQPVARATASGGKGEKRGSDMPVVPAAARAGNITGCGEEN